MFVGFLTFILPKIAECTWSIAECHAPGFTGEGEGVRLYLRHLVNSGNPDDFAELVRLGNSEGHRGGCDILVDGAGDDIIFGQAGNDVFFGGEVHYGGLSGLDALMHLINDAGGSVEAVAAFLVANPDVLWEMRSRGSESDGSNWLSGGTGNDILIGGGFNDIHIGGSGDNVLFGGKGKDTFVYNMSSLEDKEHGDVILDFNVGPDERDVLDIRDILTGLDWRNDLNVLFDSSRLSLEVEKGAGDTATALFGMDHATHSGTITSIHLSGVQLDQAGGSFEEQFLKQLMGGGHILFQVTQVKASMRRKFLHSLVRKNVNTIIFNELTIFLCFE